MPRIIGRNVMLREYMHEDIRFIDRWVNDKATTRMLDPNVFTFPRPLEKTAEFVAENIEHGGPAFVIANVQNGEYIGQIDLHNVNYRHRSAEMGIVIGVSKHRHSGYGTEAIELLLKFAFEEMNLNRISLHVLEYNTSAIACYEKLGFVREGVLRQAHWGEGKYADLLVYGILREEWERQSQRKPINQP
ncbi:MAG: GNAT family N-acetyltransferase [Clostridia bacterium]|nr:GNAT family N-acetyltransferase [Clostridia bacterium]